MNEERDILQGAADLQHLCLSCRYCCTIMTFPVYQGAKLPHMYQAFFAARQIETVYDDFSGLWLAIAPLQCPHLKEDGCDLYPNHPEACRIFDGRANVATKEHCKWPKEVA